MQLKLQNLEIQSLICIAQFRKVGRRRTNEIKNNLKNCLLNQRHGDYL